MLWRTLSTLLCAVVIQTAYADHLPDAQLAKGNPETILAGVNLGVATLSDFQKLYGKPTREHKATNNPYWKGYVWEMPNMKIELGVNIPSNQIDSIYVEGAEPRKAGRTGRGLRLGDDINAIKRIYGRKFEVGKIEKTGERVEFAGVQNSVPESITIQWAKEDFTLTAGLNEKGKIVSLWLLLPECYPKGCE